MDITNPISVKAQAKQTLQWLIESIKVHDGNGSAAYCSPFRHPFTWWAAPYPETTGYIIETLLQYDAIFPEMELKAWALRCADWLVDIQFANGSYPTLLKLDNPPSIFNTGQIVFGLADAYELTADPKYGKALRKAAQWLVDELDEHGTWPDYQYKQGYVPAYLARVTWSVLRANVLLKNNSYKKAAQLSLNHLKSKVCTNNSVEDWGFEANQTAFTHTIAYTFRGFLEAGLLIGDSTAFEISQRGADTLLDLQAKHGQLAGTYDIDWKPDHSFKCVTGHAQIAILCNRLFDLTNQDHYQTAAQNILKEIQNTPNQLPHKKLKGAIPGSSPFHKQYMAYKYPNWAAKFFLDALHPFLNK